MPDLEDALIRLDLRPAHDALRLLLDPALVRHLPDVAERAPAGPEKEKALEHLRDDFFRDAWRRCREFLREAQSCYRSHGGQTPATANPAAMEKRFHDRVRAAMRIPALESLFPKPWPAAARRVLPSPSPQLTATAMWGPVLAWTVLELLAESVAPEPASATPGGPHPPSVGECGEQPSATVRPPLERPRLELHPSFRRQIHSTCRASHSIYSTVLRLREPLAHAFESLGFEAEESWRVAARIKVALLIEAGVFAAAEPVQEPVPLPEASAAAPSTPSPERPIPVLSPALWQDPDVRWLTGEHDTEGRSYFVKESYEELLWWLQLPALCKLAAESMPARSGIEQISRSVAAAAEAAELAAYRVDALFP